MKNELEAKNERMRGYLTRVQQLQRSFESFDLRHLLRCGNTHADSLATLATSSAQNLPRIILVEDLSKPSEEKGNMVCVTHVRVGPSWIDPIIQFLSKDVLLEDKSDAKKIWQKAPWFWLSKDQKLYK